MRKFLILAIGAIGVAALPQAAFAEPRQTCDQRWSNCVNAAAKLRGGIGKTFSLQCDVEVMKCRKTGYWVVPGLPAGKRTPCKDCGKEAKPKPKPKPTKLTTVTAGTAEQRGKVGPTTGALNPNLGGAGITKPAAVGIAKPAALPSQLMDRLKRAQPKGY